MEQPLLSIKCLAYNCGPYIRRCLEGFVMQKTNFRFEAVVHDDASTDDTANVIREFAEKYPEIIKPIFETENQFSKHDGSLQRAVDAHIRGKYIAFCEGDDYWTDPLKLQKQVDILERESNVAMVYTGFQTVDKDGENITCDNFEYYLKKSKSGDVFRLLLQGNFIMTLTVCCRKDFLMNNILEKSPVDYDYAYFLTLASMGEVVWLPEKTGCYRRLPTGMIATQSTFVTKSAEKTFFYFANIFLDGKTKLFPEKEISRIKTEIVFHYLRLFLKGRRRGKLRYFLIKRKLFPYILKAFGICIWRVIVPKINRNKKYR